MIVHQSMAHQPSDRLAILRKTVVAKSSNYRGNPPLVCPLLGERKQVRSSYPLAKPLTKNHNVVPSFSPGLPRVAGATPGNTFQNPASNSEDARLSRRSGAKTESAKLICGYPIRPISPIPSGHSAPLIKVENGLGSTPSPTFHKPKIKPENKGIKPKSNRHKPNFFTTRFGGWLARKGGHVVVRPPWYLVHNLCPSVPLALFPVLRYSRRRRFSKFYE